MKINEYRTMADSPREDKMCVTGMAIVSLVNTFFFPGTIWQLYWPETEHFGTFFAISKYNNL